MDINSAVFPFLGVMRAQMKFNRAGTVDTTGACCFSVPLRHTEAAHTLITPINPGRAVSKSAKGDFASRSGIYQQVRFNIYIIELITQWISNSLSESSNLCWSGFYFCRTHQPSNRSLFFSKIIDFRFFQQLVSGQEEIWSGLLPA